MSVDLMKRIADMEAALAALKAEVGGGVVNPPAIRTVKVGNLEWQADVPDRKFTWEEARAYAASLGPGWRLPTVQELVGLWDYDKDCCPTFSDAKGWFWSSSPNDYSFAWFVFFFDGHVGYNSRNLQYGVRCVR